MAKTVDELLVYQKARDGVAAICRLLANPRLAADRVVAGQLDRGSVRVKSDIAEGFEQKTDKGFAKYLYDARGSAQEIRSQLEDAVTWKSLDHSESEKVSALYLEIAKMLSGLINHLEAENRSNRRSNHQIRKKSLPG
jgi:four helix bundle protein